MTTQKQVTKAAVIVMAAILLSRVLGLVRDIVIAGIFGQGRNTDIYYAAFNVPDLLFYLIAGGALSSAFMPVFVEYISNGKKDEAWRVFSIITTVMAMVIGVVIIVGEIFARQLVPVVAAPGFGHRELDEVAHLTRIVLPAQFFFFIGGLLMEVQWAHQRFLIPGLGPSIYNIGIIFGGAVVGSMVGPQGVEGLAWGALGGAFIGNFVLQAAAVRKLGIKFKPLVDFKHPGAIKVWKLMIPVILSLSLPQVDVWINRWFGTFLFAGAVTALDRANRLMQVPIGIFGQAIAIAFYPTLSTMIATGAKDDFRSTINYGLRVMSFISIPATVLMIVLRYPIVRLLFQHGKFTDRATHEVAAALLFYALGIFAWCSQALIARAFYSMQDTKTPVWTGTAITLVFIPMNWGLMMAFGGYHSMRAHEGLALATTIAASLHMLILLEILRRRAGGLQSGILVRSIAKVSAASAAMGLTTWTVMNYVNQLPQIAGLGAKSGAAAVFMCSLGAGAVVFLAGVKILKIEEAHAAWDMVKRRFTRKSQTSNNKPND